MEGLFPQLHSMHLPPSSSGLLLASFPSLSFNFILCIFVSHLNFFFETRRDINNLIFPIMIEVINFAEQRRGTERQNTDFGNVCLILRHLGDTFWGEDTISNLHCMVLVLWTAQNNCTMSTIFIILYAYYMHLYVIKHLKIKKQRKHNVTKGSFIFTYNQNIENKQNP